MDSSWPILVFLPHQDLNFPCIVPVEYSDGSNMRKVISNADMAHPIVDTSMHFVLGDRFHTATNPHKSHLCKYHNLELCLQANTLKTSIQESQNNRKNQKEIEKLHSPEFWNTCNFQLFDGFLSKWGNHGAAVENNESTFDHWSANIEGRISKIHN